MNINRHNYELFFIDYIESKLSGSLLLEFENFLAQNLDLALELEDMNGENFNIEKIIIKFNRNILYSDENSISINEFTDSCIAFIENDFGENQRRLFLREMKTEHRKKDFELYQETILKKQKIEFPAKKSLYRYSILHSNWFKAASVAALLAILFSLPILRNKHVGIQVAQIPVVYFPEKNTYFNRQQFSEVHKLGQKIVEPVVTHLDADTFMHKSIRQKNSNIAKLCLKDNFKLINLTNVEIMAETKFSKPLIRKNIKEIKVLAYSRWSKSAFKKVLDSQNKLWTATKLVMSGVAKVTKKKIEIKDNFRADGKLEYLVISTPKFKYERSFSARN